jgi:hypothetical protein
LFLLIFEALFALNFFFSFLKKYAWCIYFYCFCVAVSPFSKHVASRVADLPTVVQRANDYRKITGLGLAFLNIPRTYYGLLDAQLLDQCLATAYAQERPSAPGSAGSGSGSAAGPELGAAVLAALRAAGAVDGSGAAELGLVASLVAAEADETEDEQAVREAKEAAAAAAAATDADADGSFDPLAALGAAPKPPEGAEGCAALELALASMTAPGRAVPEPVRRDEGKRRESRPRACLPLCVAEPRSPVDGRSLHSILSPRCGAASRRRCGSAPTAIYTHCSATGSTKRRTSGGAPCSPKLPRFCWLFS